jgi:type I restriction enzyme S subunit
LKPDDVLAQPVVLPPRDLLGRFDDFATGVFEKCHLLRKKNRALRAARDLLLPKLLSGELSVDRIPDPAEVAL